MTGHSPAAKRHQRMGCRDTLVRYKNYRDQRALTVLLAYNKEDVVNLKLLKENLGIFS